MKYLISTIITIFVVFMTSSTCAGTLTSDPSEQNATDGKVELNNGDTFQGETVNGQLMWDITDLPSGKYEGSAFFGLPEWVLESEGVTQKAGTCGSKNGTSFTLRHNVCPAKPNKNKVKK